MTDEEKIYQQKNKQNLNYADPKQIQIEFNSQNKFEEKIPINTDQNINTPNKTEETVEKNENNSDQTKIFKYFYYLFLIFYIIMLFLHAFLIIYPFSVQFFLVNSEGFYFYEIEENWNTKLISNITNDNCNNTQDFLIQNAWAGTVPGCNCISSINLGRCDKDSKCKDIEPTNPIIFENWRGKKICKKNLAGNKTYFDLSIEANSTNCPVATRSCGIIDSYSNHLCIDSNSSCPVINIQVIDPNNFNLSNQNNFPALELINKTLIFSTNETNFDINKLYIPLIFKIEINTPCRNPYFKNIGEKNYILEFFKDRNTCKAYISDTKNNITLYEDLEYKIIDKYNQEVLYKENGIMNILEKLPSFQTDVYKRDINLYTKGYFGIKNSCFKEIKKKNLEKIILEELNFIAGNLENLNSGSNINNIINKFISLPFVFSNSVLAPIILAILSFLLFVILFLLCFVGLNDNQTHKSVRQHHQLNYRIYFYISIIQVGILGGFLGTTGIFLKNFQPNPNLDFLFKDLNCVDSYTYDLYTSFMADLVFVRKIIVSGYVLGFINSVIYFFFV